MPYAARLFVASLPRDLEVDGLKVLSWQHDGLALSRLPPRSTALLPRVPCPLHGSGFGAHKLTLVAQTRGRDMSGGAQAHFESCGHVLDAVIVYDDESALPLPLARPSRQS